MKTVTSVTHPDYDVMLSDWVKFRLTYEGGTAFKDKYLEHFSSREDTVDFNNRKVLTYVPAHAKAALNDVKNAIFQRLIDISRKGGPPTYQLAITGNDGGVDFAGNSMDSFIGRLALPELLSMGKVGIYIDKPPIPDGLPKSDVSDVRPYLYMYRTEDIRCWSYDTKNQLQSVLLRDNIPQLDNNGLVTGLVTGYRLMVKTPDGIAVTMYDEKGDTVSETTLKLSRIPLVILEITGSLLTDVADYQIALMNLSSSDMNYAFRSNFPFYTEQYSGQAELTMLRQADASSAESNPGTSEEAQKARDKEIKVGATKGRRYAKGLERPGFIHPSPEPLEASMAKQEKMKQEIRQLINLAITNIEPRRASAESKQLDEKGLESGLSYIGLELEYGEREIGRFWAEYENTTSPAVPTIQYPKKYTLKTDDDRRKEAKELIDQAGDVPSQAYKKAVMKEAISITMGYKVSEDELKKMHNEIDKAEVMIIDSESLTADLENGLVSPETASAARGYPKGEVEKARKARAERAAAVALAQSKVAMGGVANAAARGNKDMSADPSLQAKSEKEGVKLNE